MPRVKEQTVYSFDELSETAKDNARDWYRSISSHDSSDFDFGLEDIARACEALGVNLHTRTVKLYGGGTRQEPVFHYSIGDRGSFLTFTGTYSYAKGAAKAIAGHFGGDDGKELTRIARELQALQRRYFYRVGAIVTNGWRGETLQVEADYEGPDYRHVSDADGETLQELLRDVANWGERMLTAEYEYQNSDEVIDENIRANDHEFSEDGRPS